MKTISPDKIAPPVAFVIVGSIMIIISAAGVVPFGNPQPIIAEPFVRVGLSILGVLLVLAGPAFVLWDIRVSKRTSESALQEVSKSLAVNIATQLKQDTRWASEALERAKVRPRGQSLFAERSGHFRGEKKFIATHFTRPLLQRCQTLIESGKSVCLLIDSGSTLYPFFERIGQETVRCHRNKEKWLEKLTVATNNLPGIEALMVEGRIDPNNRYSPLAVECRLFPGVPLPIYAAVTGRETNDALRRLRSEVGGNTVFIGLVTGNWIILRHDYPVCPVPLARGIGHLEFKQTMVDHSDEIYVVAPLGKIFAGFPLKDVNEGLEFTPKHSDPDKQPYHEVEIGSEKATTVKLISTCREPYRVLSELSARVRALLAMDGIDLSNILRQFIEAPITGVPHILFPFDMLPKDWVLQYEIEFPHVHTRREEFTRRFFFVPPAESRAAE